MRRIGLLAVGLVCVLAAYLLLSLDRRVARAIEESAGETLGTPVRVEGVSLSLREGRGTIRGLRVANPDGFSDADAIRLEEIELEIEISSLGGQPVRVREVRIGESQVRFEVTATGDSNIGHFVHFLADHAGGDGASTGGAEPQRVAVGTLRFDGGEILFVESGDRDAEVERIDLPDLRMTRLGGEDGATGGELSREIARSFTRRVVAATAGHQVGRVVEDSLGETAGEVAESLLRGILD